MKGFGISLMGGCGIDAAIRTPQLKSGKTKTQDRVIMMRNHIMLY